MAQMPTLPLFVLAVLGTTLLCQLSVTESKIFKPPHTVFGRSGFEDEDSFERVLRKVPPFTVFGRRPDPRMTFFEDLGREQRKVPPFAVFNRPGKLNNDFSREARVAPPFAIFGSKDRIEHGKRDELVNE